MFNMFSGGSSGIMQMLGIDPEEIKKAGTDFSERFAAHEKAIGKILAIQERNNIMLARIVEKLEIENISTDYDDILLPISKTDKTKLVAL